jgi:hypothetical protein
VIGIKSIKKSSPTLSSAQLAKRLEMSGSSFSRMENGATKKPSFNNALRIIREVCGKTKVQDFIKIHYPEMSDNFAKSYSGNADVDFIPKDAEKYFQDTSTFELMMMASSNSGITKECVIAEYGSRGLSVLEKLIEKNIIHEKDGIFTLGMTKINADQETVKNLFNNLLNTNYNLDSFGKQINWLSIQYESTNRKKVTPILFDIYSRAYKEIRETFASPDNAGEDIMWAGLIMDSLINDFKENEVIQ